VAGETRLSAPPPWRRFLALLRLTPTGSISGTIFDMWIVWSLNPMKSSKVSLKRKSASILKRVPARRAAPSLVGVESMERFLFAHERQCD
jgi:hypothetical protein